MYNAKAWEIKQLKREEKSYPLPPEYPADKVIDYFPYGKAYFPGPDADLSDIVNRLRKLSGPKAFDIEATGLEIYAEDFSIRLFQVGNADSVFILRPDWHWDAIVSVMTSDLTLWGHNVTGYDLPAIAEFFNLDYDQMAAHCNDTLLLVKLLDPRPKDKGGPGHSLGESCVRYLGIGAKQETSSALVDTGRVKYGIKKEEIYPKIPISDPDYLRYAAADIFQSARLAEDSARRIREKGLNELAKKEHRTARLVSRLMSAVGMLVDEQYAREAKAPFEQQALDGEYELQRAGIEPTASGRSSSADWAAKQWFAARGVALKKTTETHDKNVKKHGTCECSGDPIAELKHKALDAEVLYTLEKTGKTREIRHVALTMRRTKRLWNKVKYLDWWLDFRGKDGRVHPMINTLQAATGRWSAGRPAVQQIPRDEPVLRGAIVADPDYVGVGIDYAQLEARVGAGLSQDPQMIADIVDGADLHEVSAIALYGEDFTDQERQRAKSVTFGRFFGGGAPGVLRAMAKADPIGLPLLRDVRGAIEAHREKYAGYERWCQKISAAADQAKGLTTVFGRPLLVSKGYQAIGYAIQSTARDIFTDAFLRCVEAGLGEYVRLAIHDELLFFFPEDRVEELTKLAQECMNTTFQGVPIVTEAKVYGARWGK